MEAFFGADGGIYRNRYESRKGLKKTLGGSAVVIINSCDHRSGTSFAEPPNPSPSTQHPGSLGSRLRKHRAEVEALKTALEAWRPHLRPGVYVLEGRFAYRDGPLESKMDILSRFARGAHRAPGLKAALHRRLRSWIGGRVRVPRRARAEVDSSTGPVGFQGSVVFTRKGKTLIVDPETNRVLHVFGREDRFKRHEGAPAVLRDHLNAPPIFAMDRERGWILETYVSGTTRVDWTPQNRTVAKRFLLDSFTKYLAVSRKKHPHLWTGKVTVAQLRSDLEKYATPRLVGLFIDRFHLDAAPDLSVPVVHGHGDLRLSNLVFDGNRYFTIDWEFSRPIPFLCDLLHWILIEASLHDDPAPLREYIRGDMDASLEPAFEAAGVRFEADLRPVYLGVLLAEWLLVRLRNRGSTGTSPLVEQHIQFLQRPEIQEALDPAP